MLPESVLGMCLLWTEISLVAVVWQFLQANTSSWRAGLVFLGRPPDWLSAEAGSLSDPWVLPFWSHARLSRWGRNWQFPWPFLGQDPCSRGAWPKGNGHPQQMILYYVWVVDQAGGQAGEDGSLTPAQSFPHWSRSQACWSATGTKEWPWMGQRCSALPLLTCLQVGRNDSQLGQHHSRLSRVSQTIK